MSIDERHILYADNHLLAIDKAPGLLTQPSGTQGDNLEARAKQWIKQTYRKPGAVFLEAVHRLDRDVGGIVLFARTSKALTRLNEQMRQRTVRKIYHALVEGRWPEPAGELHDHLAHGHHHALVTQPGDPRGKPATLRYRRLEQHSEMTRLEIELVTGRYHQIRAQLAARGHPILGDIRYGASALPASGGIALRHVRLECRHPTARTPLILVSGSDLNI